MLISAKHYQQIPSLIREFQTCFGLETVRFLILGKGPLRYEYLALGRDTAPTTRNGRLSSVFMVFTSVWSQPLIPLGIVSKTLEILGGRLFP